MPVTSLVVLILLFLLAGSALVQLATSWPMLAAALRIEGGKRHRLPA